MRFTTSIFVIILATMVMPSARSVQFTHRKLAEIPESQSIANKYVVVFDDLVTNATAKSIELENSLSICNATITTVYDTALKGVSIENVSNEFLNEILNDPQVASVVPVRCLSLSIIFSFK
jgi:hypothetical protein